MSEPPGSEQTHLDQSQASDGTAMRSATWPRGTPALRIGSVRQPGEVTPERSPELPRRSFRAPWYLRLLRLAVGLTLLVLAWCGALVVALLASSALQPLRSNHIALDTTLAVLKMGGACWVGIATLAAIVAGAFSLSLALTNRDWR